MLIRQGSFDSALKKYVSATEIRNIQKFLDNLTGEVSHSFTYCTMYNCVFLSSLHPNMQ